ATAALQAALAARAGRWHAQASALARGNPELETLIARGLLAGVRPYLDAPGSVDARHARWFDESRAMLHGFGDLARDAAG
ncbi:hypothetical protein AAHH79_38670, partial [Burkholderia pseudomallei]